MRLPAILYCQWRTGTIKLGWIQVYPTCTVPSEPVQPDPDDTGHDGDIALCTALPQCNLYSLSETSRRLSAPCVVVTELTGDADMT